jgi:hypothetical protein
MLFSMLFSALSGLSNGGAAALDDKPTAPPTFDLPAMEERTTVSEGELPPSQGGSMAAIGPAITEFRASWNAEVNALADNAYEVSFRMWPLRSGGSGEGMLQLKRRAEKMKRDLGFSRYQISEYSEGVESNFPFAQRFVYAVLQFEGKR